MTARRIFSVGRAAGRDFPCLAAFCAALPPDLVAVDAVWIAELYADAPDPGGARISALGDASRYVEVRAAAGEGWRDRWRPDDDPLRPDLAYGALIEPGPGCASDALRVDPGASVEVSGVQIVAPHGAALRSSGRARLSGLLIGHGGAGSAVELCGDGRLSDSAILSWGAGSAARLSGSAKAERCRAVRAGQCRGPSGAFLGPVPSFRACVASGYAADPAAAGFTPREARAALFADLRGAAPAAAAPSARAAPLSGCVAPLFSRAWPSRPRGRAGGVLPFVSRRSATRNLGRPPMAKHFAHAALDAAFAYVADRGDRMALCQGAPADYVAASRSVAEGGVRLGGIEMSLGLGQGDYTVADGAPNGRKLVVGRQEGVPVAETGRADHVALISSADETLLLVTALESPVEVAAGGVVAIDSFEDEIGDPV